jgi:hypothetical protein
MLADPLIWSYGLEQIGRNPFIIKGVSGITQPKTGFRFSKLYVETLEWLHDYWTDPILAVKSPEALKAYKSDTTNFLNYYRPQRYSDHEIICLKKSMGSLPAFIILDTNFREKVIARPGYIEDAGFTYFDGRLIWAELIQDVRWENRSWSELFSYDFNSGRTTRLTFRQRYFSPVFSPSGEHVAVIDERADGTSFIQILNPMDGTSEAEFACGKDHFSYLCWGDTDDKLYAITTGMAGRKLLSMDLSNGNRQILLSAGFIDITSPAVAGDWIYFTGPAGTTQGLYRINLKTLHAEMVFRHPHGINYLTASKGELLLSAYTSDGYRPSGILVKELKGKAIQHIEQLTEPVTRIIQRASGEFPVTFSDTAKPPSVERYKKADHLFRLHSWSPVFVNPDSYQISPGVALMSQNDLSTLICWAGYAFNKSDLSHNLLASATYTGFYPTLEMDYTRKYRNLEAGEHLLRRDSSGFPPSFWQFFRFGSGIPLNYSSGAWNRIIKPGIFLERVSDLSNQGTENDRSAWMTGFSLSSSFLRKLSYRDLFPKWGLSMNFSYFKAFSPSGSGNNVTGRLVLYLPGLLPNSSLRILNSTSHLTFDQFLYSLMDLPRGQVAGPVSNNYNFKIDYAFPVAYPDYHISWLIYIKRIKADLFFDGGTSLSERNWFLSNGLDLTMDYHLLRIGILLESGIRLMYFPTKEKVGAEFLFSFSVN